MKKLKGLLSKSTDRGGGAEQIRSNWTNVQNSTKGMKLPDVLSIDKLNEQKDNAAKNLMWFHPHTNRNLAESKLKEAGLRTGMFLVRASAFKGNYVLSVVIERRPHHYHIQQRGMGYYFITEEQLFRGVDDIVTAYYNKETSRLPVVLKSPCPGEAPPMECRAQGYTNILHQSIAEGQVAYALKILSHRDCPDVDAKNSSGCTALHEACRLGQEKVVQKLLECGANTGIQQSDGHTPLMLCCIHNKPAIIRFLVENGKADPQDQQMPSGNVALHEAAKRGHLECVKTLLSLKAVAWPRNNDGTSPHELAVQAGYKECAHFIDDFEPLPANTSRTEWYHGEMGKAEAEDVLRKHDCKDGIFLVRKSSRRKNLYILVMSCDLRVYNFEIHELDRMAYYIDSSPLFPSLEHVVEYYSLRPDGLPTRLLRGVDPSSGREVSVTNNTSDRAGATSGTTAPIATLGRLPAAPPSVAPTPRPPEPDKLKSENIEMGSEIGEGEYGAVYRGTWTAPDMTKVHVAIKTLHMRHSSARENFLAEARVMVQLDHTCIVKLIGVCTEPKIMLVQELVELGSMLDYMLDYPERINVNPDLYLWASQIASGMRYLEDKHFVHRDLAARNILLKSKTQAKVGDFGLSRATGSQNDDYQASVGGRWPIKWYAPECVNYGTFSSRSDVWSFGITLWEMFTLGEQPYGDKTGAQVIAQVEKGHRLKKPPDCADGVYKLMRSCWEYDPPKRPTFRDLYRFFCEEYAYIPGIKLDTNLTSTSQI